jgi:hypothetical protein
MEGNTLAASDNLFLPVMVISMVVSSRGGKVKHGICTQHGYLNGLFFREMIDHD